MKAPSVPSSPSGQNPFTLCSPIQVQCLSTGMWVSHSDDALQQKWGPSCTAPSTPHSPISCSSSSLPCHPKASCRPTKGEEKQQDSPINVALIIQKCKPSGMIQVNFTLSDVFLLVYFFSLSLLFFFTPLQVLGCILVFFL